MVNRDEHPWLECPCGEAPKDRAFAEEPCSLGLEPEPALGLGPALAYARAAPGGSVAGSGLVEVGPAAECLPDQRLDFAIFVVAAIHL